MIYKINRYLGVLLVALIMTTMFLPGNYANAVNSGYLGDVSNDCKVNIKDATLIQKHLAGFIVLESDKQYLADVDGDSIVSINDVSYIQFYLADKLTSCMENRDGYIICEYLPNIDGLTPDDGYFTVENVPDYSGNAYIEINKNVPYFISSQMITASFETYSDLDDLGRCGVAYACIGQDLMPQGERGSISNVYPSGWKSVQYDIVSGKYLYNRCHLIGWQLTGEDANEKNLITGTRYLNISGMLPFENEVADYVSSTDNHVLYRVTPIFEGNNLVAGGVLMEAYSVEDRGKGVSFNVYCYNVQPGININYKTGDSCLSSDDNNFQDNVSSQEPCVGEYILDTNLMQIHSSNCNTGINIDSKNKCIHTGSLEVKLSDGYTIHSSCMQNIKEYAVNLKTKKVHKLSCRYSTSGNVLEYTGLVECLTKSGYTLCGTCKPE